MSPLPLTGEGEGEGESPPAEGRENGWKVLIDRETIMKIPKTIFITLILFIVLILMGITSFNSSSAQDETTEMPRKNELSQSPKSSKLRNPFLFPPGIYSLSKEGVGSVRKEKATGPDAKLEEIETSPFKVRAILISDQIRLATIGSHIVAVGDKLNGETILEIKNDRVILGKGDRKRTLHLHQSPVQLTIEAPPPSPSPTRGEDRRGAEEQKKGERP